MSDTTLSAAVAAVIRQRRTIENFKPGRPPREVVLQAIELACWAPNHKHTEPWRFHLLGPESTAKLVALNTELVRRAKGDEAAAKKQQRWSQVPGWLVLTCDVCDDPLRCEEDYAACCCAAQNLALALWSHGIGVKWSTGAVTRSDEFARLLGLKPGERKIVGLFSYGYPQSVPESRRRPLADVLDERA
jgi:nitroreductase